MDRQIKFVYRVVVRMLNELKNKFNKDHRSSALSNHFEIHPPPLAENTGMCHETIKNGKTIKNVLIGLQKRKYSLNS